MLEQIRIVKPENTKFILSFKWAPSLNEYNIHGFWPESEIINHEQWSNKVITDAYLTDELKNLWQVDITVKENYILYKETVNLKIWAQQWDKHGRRMPVNWFLSGLGTIRQENAEIGYFITAIQLYKLFKPYVQEQANTHHKQILIYLDENFTSIDKAFLETSFDMQDSA